MNYVCSRLADGSFVAIIADDHGHVIDTSAPFKGKHHAMTARDIARNEGVASFADVGKGKSAAPEPMPEPEPASAPIPEPIFAPLVAAAIEPEPPPSPVEVVAPPEPVAAVVDTPAPTPPLPAPAVAPAPEPEKKRPVLHIAPAKPAEQPHHKGKPAPKR